jgi:dihydropteroate synthase
MGIVNVTPDSFSDGGLFLDPGAAVEHGRRLLAEGADILDVGGESTRPGAAAVDTGTEIERVVPVIEALAPEAGERAISIDTSKARVAEAALAAGAGIVNDVTALGDEAMGATCAAAGAEIVLMHMKGTPRTMQDDPSYDDVLAEVREFLAARVERAEAAGIPRERITIDPGIGFGKTLEHNLELLRRLGELGELGLPILVGSSRKSFLGRLTGRERADERLGGTIASSLIAARNGAAVLRVHDVAPMREALLVADAIETGRWRRERAEPEGASK